MTDGTGNSETAPHNDTTKAKTAKGAPLKKIQKKSYRWVLWLILFSGAVFAGARYLRTRSVPRVALRSHTVSKGTVRDLVSSVSAGRLSAKREITLRSELAASVKRLHVQRGQRIKANELLVTFDDSELRDRVLVADAAVRIARSQAEHAQANMKLIEANAARALKLSQVGAITGVEAETQSGQLSVSNKSVATAEASIIQALANSRLARTTLARAVVKAPFDALVLSTHVESGDMTAPGTPMIVLADTSQVFVDSDVDEADLARVRLGMAVELTFDAIPGTRFPGKISEIAPSLTRDLKGSKSMAIRVEFKSDDRLRIGMSVNVDIITKQLEHVLWVPPAAVLGRGTDRSVYVIEQGVAKKRAIEVGVQTWEAIEVKSGIQEGEVIAIAPPSVQMRDGLLVEPLNSAATKASP